MAPSLRLAVAAGALVVASALAGCTPTVHLEPAHDANNPACADVSVRLKDVTSISDQERRWTDAQATRAWGPEGEDSSIILRCGVTVPAPTAELQCVSISGIDWLVDASETPYLRMTTYGRDPAVQVYVNTGVVSSNDVLASGIAPAVASIPAERSCTDPDLLPEDYEG